MPTYSYTCANGHSTDRLYLRSTDRKSFIYCPVCHRRARFSISATFQNSHIAVDPDAPVHYNPTLGMVIRSRRHLREVQKRLAGERGIHCQNYEKVRERPADWKERGRASAEGKTLPPGVILNRPGLERADRG